MVRAREPTQSAQSGRYRAENAVSTTSLKIAHPLLARIALVERDVPSSSSVHVSSLARVDWSELRYSIFEFGGDRIQSTSRSTPIADTASQIHYARCSVTRRRLTISAILVQEQVSEIVGKMRIAVESSVYVFSSKTICERKVAETHK